MSTASPASDHQHVSGVIPTALFELFHQPTRAAFATARCVCGLKPYFGIVANRKLRFCGHLQ